MKKYSYTYDFNCTECGSIKTRRVGNLSSDVARIKSKVIFCSSNCRAKWNAENSKKNICKVCNKKFQIYESTKQKQFCSHLCYHQDMKDNPEKYGLLEKVKLTRANANTEASIQKMKETKLQNGTMIDWRDAKWKQFWRKCNDLTRKARSLKLIDWDGIDYIDGEYIKDNLILSHKDLNYPTLDHIKPKSLCYKEGLTPYEACDLNNLAWTKRTNNSKKGIKYKKEV